MATAYSRTAMPSAGGEVSIGYDATLKAAVDAELTKVATSVASIADFVAVTEIPTESSTAGATGQYIYDTTNSLLYLWVAADRVVKIADAGFGE